MVNPYAKTLLRGGRSVFLSGCIAILLFIAGSVIFTSYRVWWPQHPDLGRIYELTRIKVPPRSRITGSLLHGGLVPQLHARIEIDQADVPEFRKWLAEEASDVGQDKDALNLIRREMKYAPEWWDPGHPCRYITFGLQRTNGVEMGLLNLDEKKTAVLHVYALMR